MQVQKVIYICLLIASSLTSASLGLYALVKRRNSKCFTGFAFSMLAVTVWSVAHTFEMLSSEFSTKLFWANTQYFAYCYSPVALVALCLQFTGYGNWVRKKSFFLIMIIPTIIMVLVWTDRMHGLVRYDMHMDYSGIFPVIVKKYGPAFYVHAIYSHLLNLFAWAVLIKAVFFNNAIYKKQAAALLFGVSLIVIPNVLYVMGASPVKKFDLTPVFFGPAGMIIAWSIFRYKFFDLVPIARDEVLEIMESGIMVLDNKGRVLDINPAFANVFGAAPSQISSKKLEDVCGKFPELLKACLDGSIAHTEFVVVGDSPRVYGVFLSPLADPKGNQLGRMAVLYDITGKTVDTGTGSLSARESPEHARRVENEDNEPAGGLTERQLEVLKMAAEGISYKDIGEALGLTERTIKYHMGRIMEMLHLENRSQVIAYAAQMGLIESRNGDGQRKRELARKKAEK